ncbi:MAG: DNA polymerase III subunit chi [Pseudomonadaceae bacterium]|jgi:hypothetical protein|nr:DNA polymerase III subunit chi [Pseudomonadaceae bacterium]
MDSEQPGKPSNLLNDLESIRQLLEQSPIEPPLLTELFDPSSIPLLDEIVDPADLGAPLGRRPVPSSVPASRAPAAAPLASAPAPAPAATPAPTIQATPSKPTSAVQTAIGEHLQLNLHPAALELSRLDRELRTAAQLMLQDVIDDFVPQIEAELKRRLDLQLTLLLNQRKR